MRKKRMKKTSKKKWTKEIEVQLAYAIGVAEPVSIWVNTFVPQQKR